MTKLKVGDRVRLRGTQDRGLVRWVGEHDFDIAFDGPRSQTGSYLDEWHNSLTRDPYDENAVFKRRFFNPVADDSGC
jgi:hypothetical protein